MRQVKSENSSNPVAVRVSSSVLKGPGKRGHLVADTLLPMMFLGLRKLHGKHLLRTQNVSEQNQTFFVSRAQNLCLQQMLRARANGETFVSATMCPLQCVLVCQGLKLRSPLVFSASTSLPHLRT